MLTANQKFIADATLETLQEIIAEAAEENGRDITDKVFSVQDICRLIGVARDTLDEG